MAGLNHSVIETLYGSYSNLGGKTKNEWKDIIYSKVVYLIVTDKNT